MQVAALWRVEENVNVVVVLLEEQAFPTWGWPRNPEPGTLNPKPRTSRLLQTGISLRVVIWAPNMRSEYGPLPPIKGSEVWAVVGHVRGV